MSASASVENQHTIANSLLKVAHELYAELHHVSPDPERLALDSDLDRDLGFDSLARVELLMRLERTLGVQLQQTDVLGSAETLADLLHAAPSAVEQQADASLENAYARESSPLRRLGHSAAGIPASAATLNEVLDWQAHQRPRVTHAILVDGFQAQSLTHRVLHDRARGAAGSLQRAGVQPGDTVALMLPTALEYFYAFFGALLAGAAPVPIYPPTRPSQIEEHVRRHVEILANAQASVLVTSQEARMVAHVFRAQIPTLREVLSIDDLNDRGAFRTLRRPPSADSIAVLQYTSGSTGSPKGVVLTHRQLLANITGSSSASGSRPMRSCSCHLTRFSRPPVANCVEPRLVVPTRRAPWAKEPEPLGHKWLISGSKVCAPLGTGCFEPARKRSMGCMPGPH